MAFIRIPNAGSTGVIKDLSAHELPLGVWTDCTNIRFYDGRVHQSPGHEAIYGATSVIPHHVIPVLVLTGRYWLYMGLNKAYSVAYDGSGETGVHTDITPAVDFTGTPNGWTSTILGGIPVVNAGNVKDLPQFWDLDITHPLADLAAWPAATYCESMRSYKNYLIAMNVTKGVVNYPFMVKWSAPAEPGSLPVTWDETDPTNDAGEVDLAQGYDSVIDGLQLRDSFMIYKESSIWRMDYTGGPYVFKISKVLGDSGAMNRNCIVEVNGSHFVLTGSDIILHDGNQGVSILDNITRRFLFDDINSLEINRVFVFKNTYSNEIFVCYPAEGATYPNRAMTWNYRDKTISFREMPDVHHAAIGSLGTASGAWSLDSASWESDTTTWNASGTDASDRSKALLASNNTQLYKIDAAYLFEGLIPGSMVERRGMAFGVDSQGNISQNDERRVLVKSIRPRITGSNGQEVTISVGYSDTDPYADPTYSAAGVMTHTIGTTVKDSCLVSGRYIAIKFETTGTFKWTLDSLDIEFEMEGLW